MSTYHNGNHSLHGHQSHWKTVSTYTKCNHSINGYQSLDIRAATVQYTKGCHSSMAIGLTVKQYPHITSATRASTAICLTGNQCPHTTSAATASSSISPFGNHCPHINSQAKHLWLSASLYITVQISFATFELIPQHVYSGNWK